MLLHNNLHFSVSISETTDSGIKISTGFDLTDESDGATDPSGLTLTFTDGSKLDLIEAGNAIGTHIATVPGASGEQGVTGDSKTHAPTGLTYGNASDKVWDLNGIQLLMLLVLKDLKLVFQHQLMMMLLQLLLQHQLLKTHYSVGLSYVTTAGDTTVTVGGGFVQASDY